MAGRMDGRRCLVTAAGQGIGRASALALAAEGAEVLATDRDPALLATLSGPGLSTAVLDVLDAAAVARIGAAPFDVLVSCAGIVQQNTALSASEAEWDAAFDLNVKAMWRLARAVLPGMVARRRGAIVTMASACSSLKAAPNRFVYAATKAAVIGLTKSIAMDWVADGVRANAVCPGTVDTPSLEGRIAANAAAAGGMEAARAAFVGRQAMGRLATAEEIAGLVVYLASDESAFMTGQAVLIDGGWTL